MQKLVLFLSLLVGAQVFANENLEFTYELSKSQTDPSLIYVDAKITNHGTETIYFLSESCNKLDYYISTSSPKAQSYILVHCNASFPRKVALIAKSTFGFQTKIKVTGGLEQLQLTLQLILLNKDTTFGDESIGDIKSKHQKNRVPLKGPILSLKDLPKHS